MEIQQSFDLDEQWSGQPGRIEDHDHHRGNTMDKGVLFLTASLASIILWLMIFALIAWIVE